jgi:acyl-CoA thioesterase-1
MVLVGFSPVVHSSPSTILVVGDSLSAAYGIPINQGWVSLLEERLKHQQLPYQIVNISMSGDTTSQGLTKLPAALNQYQPAVVIIALGANDGLRGLPTALIQKNLDKLVLLSKQRHAKVLLIGLLLPLNYGPLYRAQFERVYSAVTNRYHLRQVPFLLKDIALNPDLMQADGLHPNATAQPLIVDNVWPFLEKTLSSKID